jgi:hypothetical protein
MLNPSSLFAYARNHTKSFFHISRLAPAGGSIDLLARPTKTNSFPTPRTELPSASATSLVPPRPSRAPRHGSPPQAQAPPRRHRSPPPAALPLRRCTSPAANPDGHGRLAPALDPRRDQAPGRPARRAPRPPPHLPFGTGHVRPPPAPLRGDLRPASFPAPRAPLATPLPPRPRAPPRRSQPVALSFHS